VITEYYYILDGDGIMTLDDQDIVELHKDTVVEIRPGTYHQVKSRAPDGTPYDRPVRCLIIAVPGFAAERG